MIERIKYINHINEVIEFGTSGIFVNSNDLRDFSWITVSINERISSFKKGITTKKIPVVIKCESVEEGISMKNRLFEVCEKDVLTATCGKLYIGDYYLRCFITGSNKSSYNLNKSYMQASLTLTTDFPYWIKETTTMFDGAATTTGNDMDFESDFNYDYTPNTLNQKLVNRNFVDSNFRLVIYGTAENPEITIGGQVYSVDVSIGKNEYLTIDSIEKTIVLTKPDGSTVNCFNYRNKDSYVFQKVPIGELDVLASSSFNFAITLLEERGEPKWT